MSEVQPDLLQGEYHAVDRQRREFFGMSAPAGMSLSERRLWNLNPEDHDWRSPFLHEMPDYLAGYFADRYAKIFPAQNGRRRANAFLRQTVGQNVLPRLQLVRSRYRINDAAQHELPFIKQLDRLPGLDRQELRNLSYKVASFLSLSMADFVSKVSLPHEADELTVTRVTYRYVAELAALTGTQPPYWAEYGASKGELALRKAQSGLLRMTAPEWWRARLKRMRDIQREHMSIAVGQVQRSASPYVSRGALTEWTEQKKKNAEFFSKFDLVNDAGDRVSMADMVYRSVANPAIRRCELMVRMRGFEELAEAQGYIGEFYTITAPSRFHSAYSKGGLIPQWDGASPKDTQKYLCKVWEKVRAALGRNNLRYFGFRVVEPHHDGTPHWHLLVFMRPEDKKAIRRIIHRYACEEDAHELRGYKARKARFCYKAIDPRKGSATGYIAKYISKNIDGFALDGEIDKDSGQPMKEVAKRVNAWASRWRIRQFQQLGGAPVSVWRELRRLGDAHLLTKEMDDVLASASVASCWASYTMCQGGPLVARKDLLVRLCYEITEAASEYGEDIQRVQGIYSPQFPDSEVVTRLVKWEKVAKLAEASAEAGFSGGNAAPWSSVNNCTGPERRRLKLELKSRGFEGGDEEIDILLRGSSLSYCAETALIYKNGRLSEKIPHSEDELWPG
ncbi:replication endonuclease [Mixta mediterraneensis]|uniref:replication endonuclease n=1 Tax=Mixta mediterraneensis TaxID=2758443 RepID=UPI00187471E4|nr:replication endonuclease [Mixta mediterraneensis]MBE5254154.1 replication endonuclease [Mixta mediterraneensis]